jgi:hypothetical protein
MPKIAVDDDVLEGLVKAARQLVELTAQGVVPQDTNVAVLAYASLERLGSVFLDDGRLGPDVERALLWVDGTHIESKVVDATGDTVLAMLNGDWDGLGEEAYEARDALVASVAERNTPASPVA